jgi:hypothetical protein
MYTMGKGRYRVALPSDRMHHWWVGHESPVCIALDSTHLYCDYDQCHQQCGCEIPSHPKATGYHCCHVRLFLYLTSGEWLTALHLSHWQPSP